MTISNQVSAIFEHPFFKQAVKHYNLGNAADLKHVLSVIMVHTHQTVRYDCVKKYKANKWFNIPEIITVISEVPFPEKINYELPIPLLIEQELECKVVPLKIKVARYPKINMVVNQLELPFVAIIKPQPFLAEA